MPEQNEKMKIYPRFTRAVKRVKLVHEGGIIRDGEALFAAVLEGEGADVGRGRAAMDLIAAAEGNNELNLVHQCLIATTPEYWQDRGFDMEKALQEVGTELWMLGENTADSGNSNKGRVAYLDVKNQKWNGDLQLLVMREAVREIAP